MFSFKFSLYEYVNSTAASKDDVINNNVLQIIKEVLGGPSDVYTVECKTPDCLFNPAVVGEKIPDFMTSVSWRRTKLTAWLQHQARS